MEIIRMPRIMQETGKKYIQKGKSVGFVPTMGAIHEGHLSLVKRSRMDNDITVSSIFVNPKQFGPSEDLEKYPRDIEGDIAKFQSLNVDVLFLPDNALVYPKGFASYVLVDALSDRLCGGSRPGHFRGVATVVAKLFNIVSPVRAYFGQKDFQQTVLIRRMVKDLNFDVDIVVCPTIREHDGLAMSSRNAYLNQEQRKAATVIFRCLNSVAEKIRAGERSGTKVREMIQACILSERLISSIEYASVYDPETLEEREGIEENCLLAVAVRIGETRLIDNILLNL